MAKLQLDGIELKWEMNQHLFNKILINILVNIYVLTEQFIINILIHLIILADPLLQYNEKIRRTALENKPRSPRVQRSSRQ